MEHRERTMNAKALTQPLDLEPITISPESGVIENKSRPRGLKNPRVRGLIEAAAHCFAERGVGATTLADISRELGLRKSIIHYYFDNKDALLERVQEFSAEQYLSVVRDTMGGPREGHSGLHDLWSALKGGSANPGLAIELISEGRRDADLRARARATEDQAHNLVAGFLKDARQLPDESASDLAWATLALLHGLMLLSSLEGTPERADRAFAAFFELLTTDQEK
jgi:AcrR family transcriptional regulator